MHKSFKIQIIATFVIMSLFCFQSFVILNLSQKNSSSKALFGAMKHETIIKNSFLKNENIASSLKYKFAIYDVNFKPVISTLSKEPSSFKFVTLEEGGYLFYKSFFIKDKTPYYIVVEKELDNKKNIFLTAIMLLVILVAVLFIVYFLYLSSVKPYKEFQKYMNNFFNDAMHELKTPLGVAGMNLEMLGLENKYITRIKNALKQMQITYEDVEFFIKRGYIKFPLERLNLGEYVKERVKFLSSVADVKHIVVKTNLASEAFTMLSKVEAQRIIDNTITNAIKYSPKESEIIVNLEPEADRIKLSVQDFGKGIKDVKRVWKRYVREDEIQGGFGLGLNIVSEICQKHEILYGVDSVYGEGSTFYYKFKRA